VSDLLKTFLQCVSAILAVFFSAWLALKMHYKKTWWEKKAQAYAEIIDALHDIVRYLEMTADEDMRNDEHEHPKKKEFESKYNEAYWKVQKVTDVGAFIISKESADILNKLRDRPRLKWEENPLFEIYGEEAKHYRAALSEIRERAKKELRV
jgi:hypothetical protein